MRRISSSTASSDDGRIRSSTPRRANLWMIARMNSTCGSTCLRRKTRSYCSRLSRLKRSGSLRRPVLATRWPPLEKCGSPPSICSAPMTTDATDAKLSRLSLKIDGAIATVELRNPPLNVIDVPMMGELAQTLAELETRRDVSVIQIGGSGKGFSAGVDVAAHTPANVEEMLTKFHGVIRALVGTKMVSVAVVDGHCLGGGAELAMMCDMVYTAEDAEWGFPEITLGCYPPVACTTLAALVGQKRAAELILTGRAVSGREATEIGL